MEQRPQRTPMKAVKAEQKADADAAVPVLLDREDPA